MAWYIRRHQYNCASRNIETILVRVKREHSLVDQFRRAYFHTAHCCVAVFYRKREFTAHKRAPHARVLAARHATVQNQGFSTPAERTIQGPHAQFTGLGRPQFFLTDFGLTGSNIPEGVDSFGGTFLCHSCGIPNWTIEPAAVLYHQLHIAGRDFHLLTAC